MLFRPGHGQIVQRGRYERHGRLGRPQKRHHHPFGIQQFPVPKSAWDKKGKCKNDTGG